MAGRLLLKGAAGPAGQAPWLRRCRRDARLWRPERRLPTAAPPPPPGGSSPGRRSQRARRLARRPARCGWWWTAKSTTCATSTGGTRAAPASSRRSSARTPRWVSRQHRQALRGMASAASRRFANLQAGAGPSRTPDPTPRLQGAEISSPEGHGCWGRGATRRPTPPPHGCPPAVFLGGHGESGWCWGRGAGFRESELNPAFPGRSWAGQVGVSLESPAITARGDAVPK